MKRGLVITIIVVVFMGIILFTQLNQNQDNEIRVGIVAPLTGDAGIYGADTQRAIQIAEEDIAKYSDKEIRVFYEDACLAQDALRSIEKLILVDKVDLVSGVFCIPSVSPISTRTKSEKISVMMTASVPDSIIESNSFVFSPNSAIRGEAYAQAEFAYNQLGARTASVVWMNSDFGSSYNKNFAERFRDLGGEIFSNEPLEFFGTDYRGELSKVKSQNPDVLLAVHFGNQMALILRQSKELGIDSRIIGTYEAEDKTILEGAGGFEGLIISSPVGAIKGENYEKFNQKYNSKYGEEPTTIALMAYDSFKLQVDAHIDCEGDKDCIIENLKGKKGYDGASGVFDLSTEGPADREFIFKEVREGEYIHF